MSFIDYVCRSESEKSFPALVGALLSGRRPGPCEIPGVYLRDRETNTVQGVQAGFVDLDALDQRRLLRYHFTRDELLLGGRRVLAGGARARLPLRLHVLRRVPDVGARGSATAVWITSSTIWSSTRSSNGAAISASSTMRSRSTTTT